MSKVFNIEKYGQIVREVLTDLKARNGGKIAWSEFCTARGINNNLGTVLHRTGLIIKRKNGDYKCNIAMPYVSKSTGIEIAKIIKQHDLIRFPQNAAAFEAAKEQLLQLNIAKDPNRVENRGRKAVSLASFSTDALLDEIRNRTK